MVLRIERCVATYAVTDDARRIRIVTNDSDRQGGWTGQHAYGRLRAGRCGLSRIHLDECLDEWSRGPVSFAESTVDGE